MFRHTFSALTVIAALGASALLPATALAKDHGRHDRGRHVGRGHIRHDNGLHLGRTRVRHDNGLHLGRGRLLDREHRDYHRWSREEDTRYRQFLTERHRPYVVFPRAGSPLQRDYWQWRHDHGGR